MSQKTFHTFDQQADLILSRGCTGNKEEIISFLKSVNYYRFTGFLFPYRKSPSDDMFVAGTTFELVKSYYLLDRRLRLLLLDAIERIEIALRTKIAYFWAKSASPQNNPQKSLSADVLAKFQEACDKSKDDCVVHHKNDRKIVRAEDLPVWVFVELGTFSQLSRVFNKLPEALKKEISNSFGISRYDFFASLLIALGEVRNYCAHHARIWNRKWIYKEKKQDGSSTKRPIIKKEAEEDIWYLQLNPASGGWIPGANKKYGIDRTRLGFVLLACAYLTATIAPYSQWRARCQNLLLNQCPKGATSTLGLPAGWESHPVWSMK